MKNLLFILAVAALLGAQASPTGIRIVVRDSSGVVLQEARLDSNSEVTLNRPQGDFSVLFDGGAGHSVEVRGDSLVR